MTLKRLLAILLTVFLLISVSGCIPFRHKALALDGESPVVSIELYDLPYLEMGQLEERFSDTEEASEPLRRLPEERIEDCISEIRTWVYNDNVWLLPVAMDAKRAFGGYAVKVTYENGNWEMLESDVVGWYDGTEMYLDTGGITKEIWGDFLMEYFEVETRSSKAYSN